MKIEVKRIARKDTYTIGKMYVDDNYICDTLEDKDRGLKATMSLSEIALRKVKDKTCIPAGTYNVKVTYSNRFKRNMPQLLNVPGFEGIRIHAGNTDADTSGCILVGYNKVKGKVINSRETYNKVYDMINNCKGTITLHIE